jgi:hypothetical protein
VKEKTIQAQVGPAPTVGRKRNLKRLWSRLSAHKRRARLQHRYISENVPLHKGRSDYNPHKLNALYHCGTHMHLKEYITGVSIVGGQTCKQHTLCPLCAIVRAAKYWRTYREKYLKLLSQNKALSAYYLVLTVKNEESLPERFDHLQNALRKLLARRNDATAALSGTKSKAYALNSSFAHTVAGAYSIEIKRGKNSNQWHPHANVLLISEGRIDITKLAGKPAVPGKTEKVVGEWEELTGDSFIVDIQKITTREEGFREVFKYALKFSAMHPADTWLAFQTLYGKRLFGSFGAFRGLNIDDNKIDLNDVPYIERLYSFAAQEYQLTGLNYGNGYETSGN